MMIRYHKKIKANTDIYSHSLQKADVEAADKLENLFNNQSNKTKKQL